MQKILNVAVGKFHEYKVQVVLLNGFEDIIMMDMRCYIYTVIS